MEITNVKIHCKVNRPYLLEFRNSLLNSFLKKQSFVSFCVLRIGRFVYNCFNTGYINVTGLKSAKSIKTALDCLLFNLGLPMKSDYFNDITIDNISAKNNIIKKCNVNLFALKSKLKHHPGIISIKYNRERFPNMFIKLKYGVIIWSPNNKICCVGVKKSEDLVRMENEINTFAQL